MYISFELWDCNEFLKKKMRERCKQRNSVIEEFKDTMTYANKAIDEEERKLDRIKEEMALFTKLGKKPSDEILRRYAMNKQSIEVLKNDRFVMESEMSIALMAANLGVDRKELREKVLNNLKAIRKDLRDREAVQAILNMAASEYDSSDLLETYAGQLKTGGAETAEPTIDEIRTWMDDGIPIPKEWEERLRETEGKDAKNKKQDRDHDLSFER
jgi:hypothetical protein